MQSKNGLNVLSVFDGISCGLVALQRAGIEVSNYYASEIDKHAIKVSERNYPDIVRLGDVSDWRDWDIDWSNIDLIIGGSPCQGFSVAGDQLAFNDPRSVLFFEFANIITHTKAINPSVKFMLENVKMKKEFVDIISKTLGVEPLLVNSSLLSAQNRERLYWSNFDIDANIEDKEIYLSDIAEDIDGDRPCKLTGKESGHVADATDIGSYQSNNRIYSRCSKSPTLTTMGGGHREPKILCKNGKYRKLSIVEMERLQTLDDSYTAGVSDTQRKKMIGNGWTVDVIAHIFKEMLCQK